MNPEDQRIAIATACGWKKVKQESGLAWGSDADKNKCWMFVHQLPDYLNDLNAMHTVEFGYWFTDMKEYHNNTVLYESYQRYCAELRHDVTATANQRASAFLRTIGKLT